MMTADEYLETVAAAVAKLFELGSDEEVVVSISVDPRRGKRRHVMVYLPEGSVVYVQPDGSTVPIAMEIV